jgi:hypothetical protein
MLSIPPSQPYDAQARRNVHLIRLVARYAICAVRPFQLIFEPSAGFTSWQPTCHAD